MTPSLRRALVSFLLLASLSGCSWLGMDDWGWDDAPKAPPPGTRDFNAFPYEQMAPEAPPVAKPEFRTPQPTPPDEYLWRRGFWSYEDGKGFVWNAGYWMKKPAFTAVWKPDYWIQHTYGWALVRGHWE